MAACAGHKPSRSRLDLPFRNLIKNASPPQTPSIRDQQTKQSISYGQCETVKRRGANVLYNSPIRAAGRRGAVSVFVAAGSTGRPGGWLWTNSVSKSHFNGIGPAQRFCSLPNKRCRRGTDFSDTTRHQRRTYLELQHTSASVRGYFLVPKFPWNISCAGELFPLLGLQADYAQRESCNGTRSSAPLRELLSAGLVGRPSGCATGAPSTADVAKAAPLQGMAEKNLLGRVLSVIPANGLRGHACVSHSCRRRAGLWS